MSTIPSHIPRDVKVDSKGLHRFPDRVPDHNFSDEDDWEHVGHESDLDDNEKQTSSSTLSPPKDPKERARLLFDLCDPPILQDSPYWEDYITYRKDADALDEGYRTHEGGSEEESTAPCWDAIEESVAYVLKGNEKLKEISKDEWTKIADGLAMTFCQLTIDSGDLSVRGYEVITRIHSPMSTNSVDVHFSYFHRPHTTLLDWYYTLGFKINDSEPEKPLRTFHQANENEGDPHTLNGWRSFGWFWLQDDRRERSVCGLTRDDLRAVREALFGSRSPSGTNQTTQIKPQSLADAFDLQTVARLILAAVGLKYNIITENPKDSDDPSTWDGYLGTKHMVLMMKSYKPGISPAHVRKICGVQSLRGDDDQLIGRTEDGEIVGIEEIPNLDAILKHLMGYVGSALRFMFN